MEYKMMAPTPAMAHKVYSTIMPFYFTSGADRKHENTNKKQQHLVYVSKHAMLSIVIFVYLARGSPLQPKRGLTSTRRKSCER